MSTSALSAAYTNPFDIDDLDAVKYPDWCNPYARTYQAYERGDAVCNTVGIGYVGMNPAAGVISDPTNTEDGQNFFVIQSLSTGTTTSYSSSEAAPADSSFEDSNARFVQADFGTTAADNKYRVICAGIKIRYQSREDQRGGTYYLTHRTSHETLLGATVNVVSLLPETIISAIDDEWHMVTAYPTTSRSTQYANAFTDAAMADAGWETCLGVLISFGDVTVNASFTYEATVIFEVIGPDAHSASGPGAMVSIPYHGPAMAAHVNRLDASGSKAFKHTQARPSSRVVHEAVSLGSQRRSGGGSEAAIARMAGDFLEGSNLPYSGYVAKAIRSKKVRRYAKKGFKSLKKFF